MGETELDARPTDRERVDLFFDSQFLASKSIFICRAAKQSSLVPK